MFKESGLIKDDDGILLSKQGAGYTPVGFLFRDVTNSRLSATFSSGAKWLNLSYRLLPGATAVTNQFLKVVLNAVSDADANGKLATDGAFIAVFQGDDIELETLYSDPITRVDFITEQAVGAEKTVLSITGGV